MILYIVGSGIFGHGHSLPQHHAAPSFYTIRGYIKVTILPSHVDFLICDKLCCISALPSKTDFKARTARFKSEGRLVWKEGKSEKVLVLFYVCSDVILTVQMTSK